MSDFGPKTSFKIVDQIRERVHSGELRSGEQIRAELKAAILGVLAAAVGADGSGSELRLGDAKPGVVLVVGVNGGGKTTTIGKLANKFGGEGAQVSGRALSKRAVWVPGKAVGVSVLSKCARGCEECGCEGVRSAAPSGVGSAGTEWLGGPVGVFFGLSFIRLGTCLTSWEPPPRAAGGAGCWRHLPCCRCRAAGGVGAAQQRADCAGGQRQSAAGHCAVQCESGRWDAGARALGWGLGLGRGPWQRLSLGWGVLLILGPQIGTRH